MTTYLVAGMTCQHCVTAVTEQLRALPDVEAVDVALVEDAPSRVSVTSRRALDAAAVAAAVDEAGYELVGVVDGA
jgi:copper chaperone CopZ